MEQMKFHHLALFVLLGTSCSQRPPAPTAKETLRRAMEALGSKAAVRVALNARLSISQEPSRDYSSTGLWRPPALLFVRSKADHAESPINFVWIEGDETWGYHELVGWGSTANELGRRGAATGIENPRDLFRILQSHTDEAIFLEGGLQLTVLGRDVRSILAPLVLTMKIDEERSGMDLRFTIAEDGLLRSVAFKARLFGTLYNVSRLVECAGELTLSVKEVGPEFPFQSSDGRIIQLSEDLKKRIASSGTKNNK
jgi:hypothetical protein